MNKFLYKYDINKYIDKVYETVLDLYPWATIDMIKGKYEYAIEKENNVIAYWVIIIMIIPSLLNMLGKRIEELGRESINVK